MSAKPPRAKARASKPATGSTPTPGVLDALSDAIESGAGLPEVTRAAAKVLEASIALIDRSSAVLAVAAPSPAEETRLLEAGRGDRHRASASRTRWSASSVPAAGGRSGGA